ncbi:MAG: hypothetical protein NTX25_11420, partial [Proteobacteria bacterium]|nr:hypothetical protein [Pseudomonadota bacterium]
MKNVLVFSLIVFLSSFPLNAQIFRPELQLSLQEKLCQNQGKIPKTQELWQVGLYETQLDAAWVYSRSPSHPLQIAELASIAAEQALTHGHQGYSYGLCNAKVAWIISTPSASAPFK